jgi:hypothetical protein
MEKVREVLGYVAGVRLCDQEVGKGSMCFIHLMSCLRGSDLRELLG